MDMFDRIGRGLAGFGAGYEGHGMQYLQQLQEEEQSARLAELGNAVSSGQIDQTQYLKGVAKYAPDLYGKIVLAQTQNMPSAIREFEYIQKLNPQQEKKYQDNKRRSVEELLRSKGVDYNPITGQANDMPGYGTALGDIARAENFGGKTGALEAQLQLEPSLQAQNKTAELNAANKVEKNIAANEIDLQTPLLDRLIALNEKTQEGAYGELGQIGRRMMPGVSEKEKAMDELLQGRINLSAPLAKELGTNPTDADFQASLKRVFDGNAPREVRAAQLLALKTEAAQRKRALQGNSEPPYFVSPPIGDEQTNVMPNAVAPQVKFLGFE